MNDFHFQTGVLRGDIAEQLGENLEGAAWVLAQFAEDHAPGFRPHDELCEHLNELSDEQRDYLATFARSIVAHLDPTPN